MSLLEVRDLGVSYPGGDGPVLDGVSFEVARGEAVGLIGESGSGKTQTALAIMGLLAPEARATGGVRFDGAELLGADEGILNRYRPRRMAMVFQDPREALNPHLRIGEQLGRVALEHRLARRRDVPATVLELLDRVGLPDPQRQFRAYPHQLSGGMRQRAMIAAALIGEPELLIADEPTTALDVTVQAQILELLRELRQEIDSALLLISHDLGVIAGNCSRMLVLDAGRLVEQGASRELFAAPREQRTRAMIAAALPLERIPLADGASVGDDVCLAASELRVTHYDKPFGAVWRRTAIEAVRDVGLELRRGETLALVGESGSGKTSLARALLGLEPASRGRVAFLGAPLANSVARRPVASRRRLQLVFQDPAGSLNPAMRVADIVAEPLRADGRGRPATTRRAAVTAMLERVGLPAALATRFPHELSGGQAQRVAIARALVVEPAVLVCDEALAALDGTVRREILELLRREQAERGLAMLFISHDLSVVRGLAHRVMVMYMGRIAEVAASGTLFARPRHPYTRALIDSVPVPDPRVPVAPAEVRGEVASLSDPPTGCVFHPRCRYVVDRCRAIVPAPRVFDGASAACHRAEELDLSAAGVAGRP